MVGDRQYRFVVCPFTKGEKDGKKRCSNVLGVQNCMGRNRIGFNQYGYVAL